MKGALEDASTSLPPAARRTDRSLPRRPLWPPLKPWGQRCLLAGNVWF